VVDQVKPVATWERYPEAAIDQDNRALYEGWLERELRLNKCSDCGKWHHPPRSICPHCWSVSIVPTRVSGRGVVHLSILLRQGPPAAGVEYPYPVVTVELEEQEALRFTSTIVGCEPTAVRIGMPVELEWIERQGAPFPVFRPVEA
jgi:uncharacterized OB-fold protein